MKACKQKNVNVFALTTRSLLQRVPRSHLSQVRGILQNSIALILTLPLITFSTYVSYPSNVKRIWSAIGSRVTSWYCNNIPRGSRIPWGTGKSCCSLCTVISRSTLQRDNKELHVMHIHSKKVLLFFENPSLKSSKRAYLHRSYYTEFITTNSN